ncbi:MAG: DsbA family oxidoreductase [Alphaproteobacteria bacterium]|nr:DsbA family oxidoreductase [Alphaproteobacteria bacterium]
MIEAVVIDVVSDVICPWCFLGKRRLYKALGQIDDLAVTVRWRPFALDPSLPPEGMDRQDYLTRKFGAERLATLHDPLIAAGEAEGVPYRFDRIRRTPNTVDAHRLIRWAHTAERQDAVVERLFMSYWNEGQDISDHTVLASCAADAGLNRDQITGLLAGGTDTDAVKAEMAHATQIGVTGVPTFILGQRYALVGAQPADVLADAIRRVAGQNG